MAGWDVESATSVSATERLRAALLRRLGRVKSPPAEEPAEDDLSRTEDRLHEPCCVSSQSV